VNSEQISKKLKELLKLVQDRAHLTNSSEHGNRPWGPIVGEEILEQLNDYQVLRGDSAT
jgi:hypothetical protein